MSPHLLTSLSVLLDCSHFPGVTRLGALFSSLQYSFFGLVFLPVPRMRCCRFREAPVPPDYLVSSTHSFSFRDSYRSGSFRRFPLVGLSALPGLFRTGYSAVGDIWSRVASGAGLGVRVWFCLAFPSFCSFAGLFSDVTYRFRLFITFVFCVFIRLSFPLSCSESNSRGFFLRFRMLCKVFSSVPL